MRLNRLDSSDLGLEDELKREEEGGRERIKREKKESGREGINWEKAGVDKGESG